MTQANPPVNPASKPHGITLERFARREAVIRSPEASVHEAARAMAEHKTGFVIVGDQRTIVGVLTDRDIVLRMVARNSDPQQTPLRAVMTKDPATLSTTATIDDALELMRARRIRRVPLLDQGQISGLVAIDDLIMTEIADPHAVAHVVRLQLSDSGQALPVPLGRVVGLVREATGLESARRAMIALEVVVSALVRRLSLRDASDLLARLPTELRERLLRMPPRSERGVTRATVEAELSEHLHVDPARASEIIDGVATTLRALVGTHELAEVQKQLPEPLRDLLTARAPRRVSSPANRALRESGPAPRGNGPAPRQGSPAPRESPAPLGSGPAPRFLRGRIGR